MASRLDLAQLFAESGSGEVPPPADEAGAPKPTAEEFSIGTPSAASSTSPGWRRRRPVRRSPSTSPSAPRAGKRHAETTDAATSPHVVSHVAGHKGPTEGSILHTSSVILPSRDFQIFHESRGVSHNDAFLQKIPTHVDASKSVLEHKFPSFSDRGSFYGQFGAKDDSARTMLCENRATVGRFGNTSKDSNPRQNVIGDQKYFF